MITYHGNTRKTIPISSSNKPTNEVIERDNVNCYIKKRLKTPVIRLVKEGTNKTNLEEIMQLYRLYIQRGFDFLFFKSMFLLNTAIDTSTLSK